MTTINVNNRITINPNGRYTKNNFSAATFEINFTKYV